MSFSKEAPSKRRVPKDDHDDDEIAAMNLRFLFSDHKFGGPVWQGLQDAGFTYRHGDTYYSPAATVADDNRNGTDATGRRLQGETQMTFKSGTEICAFLDRFCIQPIQNTLQLPPNDPLLATGLLPQEIAFGRELRKQVVRHVYKRMVSSASSSRRRGDDKQKLRGAASSDKEGTTKRTTRRQSSIKSSSTGTNNTDKTADPTNVAGQRKLPKRQCRARPQQPQPTITTKSTSTAFEKGADTFLRKSRQKQKGAAAYSSQEFAFLKFPTVAECLTNYRTRDNNDDELTRNIDTVENVYTNGGGDNVCCSFDEWKFLLTTQNSLLVYGLGSKRHVLNSFAREQLEKDGDVVVIDGYDQTAHMESILDLLVNHFLDGQEPNNDKKQLLGDGGVAVHGADTPPSVSVPMMIGTDQVVRRAARIAQTLASRQRDRLQPLYIVIHNVDGPSLVSRTVQEALASLVAHSAITDHGGSSGTNITVNAIRMVASIDHANASALLWDNRTSAKFSWVWKEVHTYHPYVQELSFGSMEDERKRQRSKKRQADEMDDATLWSVLTSLAPRHAEVVKILATLQSEDLKPVDHVALLRSCKHKMTVASDSTLRAYLNELSDHGIVEKGKDSSTGKEWLRIPHSREKLLEIRDFEMEK